MKDRYLRRKNVEKITSLKDPQMWRAEKAGNFPKRHRLTDRTVGWLKSEVEAWMRLRPTSAGEFPNLKHRSTS